MAFVFIKPVLARLTVGNIEKIRRFGGTIIKKGGRYAIQVAKNNPKLVAIMGLAGATVYFLTLSDAFKEEGPFGFLSDIGEGLKRLVTTPQILLFTVGGAALGYYLNPYKEEKAAKIIFPALGGLGGYFIGDALFPEEIEVLPPTDQDLPRTPDDRTTDYSTADVVEIDKEFIIVEGYTKKIPFISIFFPIEDRDCFKVKYRIKNLTRREIYVWAGLSFEDVTRKYWGGNRFPYFLDIPPKKIVIGPLGHAWADFGEICLADTDGRGVLAKAYNVHIALWRGFCTRTNLMVGPRYDYLRIPYVI